MSGNSSRRTGVSYALRPRKRRIEASISSSVAGDNRTIQSSVCTRSLPSQTDLPLGRYGGWNVMSLSSRHAGAAVLHHLRPRFAAPAPRGPLARDMAVAFLSPLFLEPGRKSGLPGLRALDWRSPWSDGL